MEDVLLPVIICGFLFIGMPWIILHYITQWKKSGSITREDESLLDDLYETARRLDDRLHSIERIVAAETPELEVRRPAPELPRSEVRQIREK
ncbi:envelope stress response membrane protein PspB [Sphingomonas sp. MAH-20]|uniref:Envelope stress response membrane protein PspB n=1 Tax=Sphingomonas horti TaxID=2682842 RepID=A0A6I4J1Y4_9SPHN|nr:MULTISPECIES: envelope stress response membrane protein PspB [Sphingomonas]MBA2919854.1 envelope stress response membrane protein PspB [Sphingomonas sp. CGMCC 1.13658]MVO78093.1 envelope stress response membrane protein PspB [Sphingomonas horti]